ncbi:MAG: site-specific integrase [Lachnospiraceae bacterium]|nr:site-specific integrase [Lachnospiraceae bacterium]
MARARKLKSGSWRTLVYSHKEKITTSDGAIKEKRIYKSFTSDDPSPRGKREAEAMAAEFSLNKDRSKRGDYSTGEAVRKYIDSKTNVLSTTTIRSYETFYKNAYDDIFDIPTKNLNQSSINAWVNDYATDHAPKTVRNAHGLLSATLSIYEPTLRLKTKLPEPNPQPQYTPSDKEVQLLLKHVEGTELEKAILLAAFGTLRRGEVFALTSEDIKENVITINKSIVRSANGGMVVKSPKTNSSTRKVIYPDFVIRKFDGVEGRLVKMHPEEISKRFNKVLEKAGLPRFRFHDLRHYSASIMHAMGIPDQYIMARGGWKTDRVLKQVYRNVIGDENKKFTDKINKHFETMQHEMQHENDE